jgi:predicted enzyme related to lactoylglutathione lyase
MIARTTPLIRPVYLFAVIALVGAMAGSVLAQSGTKKAAPPDVGAGRVVWFDITTADVPAAKTFYGELFGWTFAAVPGGGDQAAEIVSRGMSIGTIRKAEGPIAAFNGVVYVQVNDIQATGKKAIALGGKMVPGFPFNLPDRPGAIALVIDPSGHPIGMYSRTPLPSGR